MDLSKIVGLIMENPDIIEKIRALATSGEAEQEAKDDLTQSAKAVSGEEKREAPDEKSEAKSTPAAAKVNTGTPHRRHDLLCALKPYVSKRRASAIDTALGIMDVLNIIKN